MTVLNTYHDFSLLKYLFLHIISFPILNKMVQFIYLNILLHHASWIEKYEVSIKLLKCVWLLYPSAYEQYHFRTCSCLIRSDPFSFTLAEAVTLCYSPLIISFLLAMVIVLYKYINILSTILFVWWQSTLILL